MPVAPSPAVKPVASRKLVAIQSLTGPKWINEGQMFESNELPEGASVDELISRGAVRYASPTEIVAGKANVVDEAGVAENVALKEQVRAQASTIAQLQSDMAKANTLGTGPSQLVLDQQRKEFDALKQHNKELGDKLAAAEAEKLKVVKHNNELNDKIIELDKKMNELVADSLKDKMPTPPPPPK